MTFCTNMCSEGRTANLCVQLVNCSLLTPNIAFVCVLLFQVYFWLKHGFQRVNGECVDRDECNLNAHDCATSQNCVNSIGSFECICKPGFKTINLECIDFNECDTAGTCNSAIESCVNSPGSYTCACDSGYESISDGCQNINECKDRDICDENSHCVDSTGSYSCDCDSGFRLSKEFSNATPNWPETNSKLAKILKLEANAST